MMADWRSDCRAHGGFPTVFPSGPNQGQPACRTTDAAGQLHYSAADISWWDQAKTEISLFDEQLPAWYEHNVVDPIKGIASDIAGLPADAAGKVLHLPPWLIGLVVLGVVAVVVTDTGMHLW